MKDEAHRLGALAPLGPFRAADTLHVRQLEAWPEPPVEPKPPRELDEWPLSEPEEPLELPCDDDDHPRLDEPPDDEEDERPEGGQAWLGLTGLAGLTPEDTAAGEPGGTQSARGIRA
ncbi:MAG: hypothetical protein IT537_20725 [Hyphomicrobiales bacterium]|nr:hypothetical protein [Hyphomicrobiales bacterium]